MNVNKINIRYTACILCHGGIFLLAGKTHVLPSRSEICSAMARTLAIAAGSIAPRGPCLPPW